MNIKDNLIEETLATLPDITKLDSFQSFSGKHFDFFLLALGFEERTLSISENLAIASQENNFTCDECIYFTYETSTNDNAFNEPRLKAALDQIKSNLGDKVRVTNLFCDEENFFQLLEQKFRNKISKNENNVIELIIDLSVCSSRLILTLFKLVFEIKNINLTVVYTEASVYFPLYEEYCSQKDKFFQDSEFSTTSGYESIINSNEYSEGAKENSDFIVAFAPFKVGRINKIVSDIDESILLNNDNRLLWIIGHPNFETHEDCMNRMTMQKEINQIDDESEIVHVSTLDYKRTIQTLEEIYAKNVNYHINIADLGSKMQTLGISVFYHIRPDVSVYYALPKTYHSNRYSQGIKCHWIINFGLFSKIVASLNKVDLLEIEFINNSNFPFFE